MRHQHRCSQKVEYADDVIKEEEDGEEGTAINPPVSSNGKHRN